jgi:hypothetical protein
MGRFDKKEPKLNEVKAVLQRLQGFPDDEPTVVVARPKRAGAPRSRGGAIVAAIIFIPAVALLVALYLFANVSPPDPHSAEVGAEAPKVEIRSEAVKAALEAARKLMAKGQVRAAREQLLALAWQGSPDAAWDLARSYDPNVLATVPDADAAPDVPEATRWYRTWYEAAVKEGMVTPNSVSIERIIGAMQR